MKTPQQIHPARNINTTEIGSIIWEAYSTR
jgi:hypothetical protein